MRHRRCMDRYFLEMISFCIYIYVYIRYIHCISLYTCDMIVVISGRSGLVTYCNLMVLRPHLTNHFRPSILAMPWWMVTLKQCGNVRMEPSKASSCETNNTHIAGPRRHPNTPVLLRSGVPGSINSHYFHIIGDGKLNPSP